MNYLLDQSDAGWDEDLKCVTMPDPVWNAVGADVSDP